MLVDQIYDSEKKTSEICSSFPLAANLTIDCVPSQGGRIAAVNSEYTKRMLIVLLLEIALIGRHDKRKPLRQLRQLRDPTHDLSMK